MTINSSTISNSDIQKRMVEWTRIVDQSEQPNKREKKSLFISIKIKCFENIFGVRTNKKFAVMTEPNLRWCDFYCFALWLHLGPCHVSIQFVFVCIFGRKRFSTAIQWLPECVCVYDCIIILPKRVCVCVWCWSWSTFHFRIGYGANFTSNWICLNIEHTHAHKRAHIFEIYMRAKKGTEKGTFRFATSRSLWCVFSTTLFCRISGFSGIIKSYESNEIECSERERKKKGSMKHIALLAHRKTIALPCGRGFKIRRRRCTKRQLSFAPFHICNLFFRFVAGVNMNGIIFRILRA